jgi:riboflavin kinase/FMN adenylyltransferase
LPSKLVKVQIHKNIDNFPYIPYPVVSIGTFDGVHLGHQKIISRMKEIARNRSGETVIITFDPHPRRIIYSDSWDMKLINSPKRKIDLLARTGIGHLLILPFTTELADMASDIFIKDILVGKVHAKMVVVGYDHHFGKDRKGDYKNLESYGKDFGFDVEEIPAECIDGLSVSSSKIRKALNDGNIHLANRFLGYEYSIQGTVVRGQKLGRKLGFPTANIEIDDKLKLIAANGVYACRVNWNNQKFLGMGNIGIRPTLDKHDLTIEVHIFDFDEDIYGDDLTIYWVERIRDEVRFRDLDALREQLVIDKKTVLAFFGR